jgi:hypothetical protein
MEVREFGEYREVGRREFRLIGYVGVDSGQLMITDPCYLDKFVNDEFTGVGSGEEGDFSYSGACRTTLTNIGGGELTRSLGGRSLGVASRTHSGDGVFPVYQVLVNDGEVAGLFVDFVGIARKDGDS